MKPPLRAIVFFLIAFTAARLRAQDFLDRLDDALTITAFNDQARARLSGLIDLEDFQFERFAPTVADTTSHNLINPRLTFFIDAQFFTQVYFFAQARVDRGFDPADSRAEARLDEYALRLTPWEDGRLNLQAGKFATVVGRWVERHLSWENPFIAAPLVYESLTAISDVDAPASARSFVNRRRTEATYDNNPILWGPSYATGISVAGRFGPFDGAIEMKNAALASRPESWDATNVGFDHPAFNGRVGYRPGQEWNFGLSASSGPYLRPEAAPGLSGGRGIGDYRQLLLGEDVSFAWHHWQLWAEFYEVRFEVPRVGNADAFSYFAEAKYKFAPQFFGALRWNQQLFASVRNGEGGRAPWGDDLWQTDVAGAYRFTAHTQFKLQYSLQHKDSGSNVIGHMAAAQFTVRF